MSRLVQGTQIGKVEHVPVRNLLDSSRPNYWVQLGKLFNDRYDG